MPKPKLILSMSLRAYERLVADRDRLQRECQRLEEENRVNEQRYGELKGFIGKGWVVMEPHEHAKWKADTTLGALVRNLPFGARVFRHSNRGDWCCDRAGEDNAWYETPEQALRSALKEDQPV